MVHGDTFMLGDCFALDISDKIGPGKPWNLGLVRKRTNNLKIQRHLYELIASLKIFPIHGLLRIFVATYRFWQFFPASEILLHQLSDYNV